MFNIQQFRCNLAETITYCLPRLDMNDPQGSLRTLLPTAVDMLHDYALIAQLVDPLIKTRSVLLAHENSAHGERNKRVLPLPHGLESGRLLIFYMSWAIGDPCASAVSFGFFNTFTVPAFDTWVWTGFEMIPRRNDPVSYIISWIPSQLCEDVNEAIVYDPTECLEWLDSTQFSFSFLEDLRADNLI